MTDILELTDHEAQNALDVRKQRQQRRLKFVSKRNASEKRFKYIGMGAVVLAISALVVLVNSIISNAFPAFYTHSLVVNIDFEQEAIDPKGLGDPAQFARFNEQSFIKKAVLEQMPEVSSRSNWRKAKSLLSSSAGFTLINSVRDDVSLVGTKQSQRILLDDVADNYLKGFLDISKFSEANQESLKIAKEGTGYQLNISTAATNSIKENIVAGLKVELGDVEKSIGETKEALERVEAEMMRLGDSKTEDQISQLEATKIALETRQSKFEARKSEIQAALDPSTNKYIFTSLTPTAFVFVGDAVFKIASIHQSHVTADFIFGSEDALSNVLNGNDKNWRLFTLSKGEENRLINDQEVIYLEKFKERELIERLINWRFLTGGDSREPEFAGLAGAVKGSLLLIIVTLALSFPLGVAAAVYLEEFAPKNRFTEILEVNINNLAAVPSIIFGLLGLAIFLNLFGMERGSPLVGGLVLTLMTLPTIIIASRAALRAVPPSIREAALGLGASRLQVVTHHVVPLALPGMLTGTIIGMAQALGETAPLLMIGMVAFVADVPQWFDDPSSALPVQIFLWSNYPELTFQHKTAAAIICLLSFLIVMNLVAILLRKKFERRW